MPRLKFVATKIIRLNGTQDTTPSTTAQYLESNSVQYKANGTTTLLIDCVSGDQIHINKTYTAVITALDTASASPANQIDLT